jgi:nucleotide-binding universal stress UspA family protein
MASAERLVICAIDGSTSDGNAAEVATQLAVLAQARLALVAVAPVPAGARESAVSTAWTMEEARRALEMTADALQHRVPVYVYLDSGNPVRRLVELAERKRALLLVVGTRGPLTGRPSSMVANGLARGAPCPVVVVPETAAVPALAVGRAHE